MRWLRVAKAGRITATCATAKSHLRLVVAKTTTLGKALTTQAISCGFITSLLMMMVRRGWQFQIQLCGWTSGEKLKTAMDQKTLFLIRSARNFMGLMAKF